MTFLDNKRLVTVTNIKFSCTIILIDGGPLSLNKDVARKVFSNFTVVRKQYIYTIFKTPKNDKYHINITKVPSRADVEISLSADGHYQQSFLCENVGNKQFNLFLPRRLRDTAAGRF